MSATIYDNKTLIFPHEKLKQGDSYVNWYSQFVGFAQNHDFESAIDKDIVERVKSRRELFEHKMARIRTNEKEPPIPISTRDTYVERLLLLQLEQNITESQFDDNKVGLEELSRDQRGVIALKNAISGDILGSIHSQINKSAPSLKVCLTTISKQFVDQTQLSRYTNENRIRDFKWDDSKSILENNSFFAKLYQKAKLSNSSILEEDYAILYAKKLPPHLSHGKAHILGNLENYKNIYSAHNYILGLADESDDNQPFNLSANMANTKKGEQSTVRCYNCNEIGHISKYCRAPLTAKTVAIRKKKLNQSNNPKSTAPSSDSPPITELGGINPKLLANTATNENTSKQYNIHDVFSEFEKPMQANMASISSVSANESYLIGDSGASAHYVNSTRWFAPDTKFLPLNKTVYGADGKPSMLVKGAGLCTGLFGDENGNYQPCTFMGFYVPSMAHSLLSLQELCGVGINVTFNYDTISISKPDGTKIGIATRTLNDNLYRFNVVKIGFPLENLRNFISPQLSALVNTISPGTTRSTKMSDFELWHARLGHANKMATAKIISTNDIPVLDEDTTAKEIICGVCAVSKLHRLPFIPASTRNTEVLSDTYTVTCSGLLE
jgi:hypothetical protein